MTNGFQFLLSPDFNGFIKKNLVIVYFGLLLHREFAPADLLIF